MKFELHKLAKCNKKAILLAAISTNVLATPLFAQQAQPAPADDKATIAEIVVTAEFHKNRLQDTPLAITAENAAMIEAKGQAGIAEVANSAPSVIMNAGGGAGGAQTTQISIRGIGQTDFNIGLEPGVGTYVDDVYQGIMYASTPELLDLERVEVLRGPQGTLSGRNSIGGAIRLISKQPDDKTEGYVEASYGRFNALNVRAGANVVLAPDRLFLRVNGLAKQSDGYETLLDYQCATGVAPSAINSPGSQAATGNNCKTGALGGQSVVAVRASMRAILADNIEDTLTADYTNDRSQPSANVLISQGAWQGPGYNLLASPPILNPVQNFVTAGTYYSYANFTALTGTPNQYTAPEISYAKTWDITNNFDAKFGDIDFKSITAFKRIDTDSSVDSAAAPITRALQIWTVGHHQFTQELRLSGKVGHWLDWTLGGFYYHAVSLQGGRVNLDGAGSAIPFYVPFDFAFSDPIHVTSKAGFAQVVAHVVEGLNLTGGLRYTDDSKSYSFSRFMAPGVTASLLSASVLPLNGLTGAFSGHRWDWRIAADYKISPDVNVYAQVSTGFKGGGINPRPFYAEQVLPFAPETVTSYEVGLKSELLDRRLRFNVALYQNDYNNMQLTILSCPQYVPTGAVQNCSLPANVGNSRIKGVEVEAELHPVHALTLATSASYTDFHYVSVDPSTFVTLGMKAPYTPTWKFNASAQYRFDLGKSGSITPRVDYRYQSTEETQAVNASYNKIAGYGIADGRIAYANSTDTMEFAFNVKNIFNKYYYVNLYDELNTSFAFMSGQPGRPREWSVSGKFKF